jgi:hypothetical protein
MVSFLQNFKVNAAAKGGVLEAALLDKFSDGVKLTSVVVVLSPLTTALLKIQMCYDVINRVMTSGFINRCTIGCRPQ